MSGLCEWRVSGRLTLLDVLDVLVSTKDVEGIGVEHASEAIEGRFVPAKVESRLFVIGERGIGGSEHVVKPPGAVQRVDSVRLESNNVRRRGGRVVVVVGVGGALVDNGEKAGGCGIDESQCASQKDGKLCKKHREESRKRKRRKKSARREGIVKDVSYADERSTKGEKSRSRGRVQGEGGGGRKGGREVRRRERCACQNIY